MVGKEHWRKHVGALDLEGFPKAWITRGLQEIHHVNNNIDGRMDACLGYTVVLGAEIYESIGELQEELREDQKKRALDSWDRMDTKRQLEDSLHEAQGEIAELKSTPWSSWWRSVLVLFQRFPKRPCSILHRLLFLTSAFLLQWRSLVSPSTRPLLMASSTGRLLIIPGLMVDTRLMLRRMGMILPTRRMSGLQFPSTSR